MPTSQTGTDQPVHKPQLIMLLLCSALLLALSLWFGQQLLQQQNTATLFAPESGCQLPQHPCAARQGSQSITLSVTGDQFNSHQPIPFRVDLSGYEASQVTLELQGAEMYMGRNSTTLVRQADGSYQAQVQLPACTTGTMLWRATVVVTQATRPPEASQQNGSWFEFEAR